MFYKLKRILGYHYPYGAQDIDTNEKEMVFNQNELFSSQQVDPKYFDDINNEQWIDIKNQGYTNACSAHGTATATEVKLGKALGVKCKINAMDFWHEMVQYKYGHEANGARIDAPLKFMKNSWVPFTTADGRTGKVKIEFYYAVDRDRYSFGKELHEGHAMITGLAKAKGLDVDKARFNPYVIADSNERIWNGHLMAIVGITKNHPTVFKRSVQGYFDTANSWGERWGQRGYCYLEDFDVQKLFTTFGFSIKYKLDNKPKSILFETKAGRRKRIREWIKNNKGKKRNKRSNPA